MRNFIAVFFAVLAFSTLCISCSKSEEEHKFVELSELDFGKGTYRPNPFKFLDNVPPFSWMGMPDSVKKETELEISFNEDAIRSQSSGTLALIDQNGNNIKGIDLGHNISNRIVLDAEEGIAVIPVSFTVDPEVGDSTLCGSLVVIGNELDQVNDTKLSSMATPIASWSLTHEIGINWLRWTILILVLAIGLSLITLIIYLLYNVVIWTVYKVSSFLSTSLRKILNKFNKRKGEKEKNKKDKERDPFIVDCERKLTNPYASVSQKAITLERLFIYWDYDLLESKKEYEAKMLNKRIMNAMECLWHRNTFYKYTKKGMSWSGIKWDSTLIPDPNVIPSNRNYSNIDHLTWGDIMEKHNYRGLTYHKGKPDFTKMALQSVQLSNFDQLVDANSDTERGPLQEEAFRILANNLSMSVEEVRSYKEQNRLVWHEDTDCKTLYLVPQEIHNNLHHLGGIGMLKILRKSGLF